MCEREARSEQFSAKSEILFFLMIVKCMAKTADGMLDTKKTATDTMHATSFAAHTLAHRSQIHQNNSIATMFGKR